MNPTVPEPALDREVALLRVGGDEELLKEIADIFIEDYPKVLSEIRAAIDGGDAKRLEVSAHTLKGSVANFGARIIVESAARLEQMGRAGKTDGDISAAHEFEILNQGLSALRAELEAL
jgi:HPt (histidine-containing phosphotransfer) domain-containing protein